MPDSKETDKIKEYQSLLDITKTSVLHIHGERENLRKALAHYSKSNNEFKNAYNHYQTAKKNKLEKTRPLEKSDYLFGASFASALSSWVLTLVLIGSFTGPFIVIVMPIICSLTILATFFSAIYKVSKDQRFQNALTETVNQYRDRYNESKTTKEKAKQALNDAANKLKKALNKALDSVGNDTALPKDDPSPPTKKQEAQTVIHAANIYSQFGRSASDIPPPSVSDTSPLLLNKN